MKHFDIPDFYKSGLIGKIKNQRRDQDKLKRDFEPTLLNFGEVRFLIARHFGFCYGVENAVEIAYKAIAENVGKKIYLLSEMIHNPDVNADLLNRGVKFIMDTNGSQLIPWTAIQPDDIVIVPAFGTTLEIQEQLNKFGIATFKYDTTCPFVEKVWKRANQIGKQEYTVIIHGKPNHEETRATFSHSKAGAPTLVIKNMAEAERLARYIKGKKDPEEFYQEFEGRYSKNFDIKKHLQRMGVVNQTTMLASETQGIADYLKQVYVEKYALTKENIGDYFADTRDTLCYATNDNQNATYALLKHAADFAIVAGGYNSSNTSHIVELCEQKLSTYFIESAENIINSKGIKHFDFHTKTEKITADFLPKKEMDTIMLTCGASCPDSVIEAILQKVLTFYPNHKAIDDVIVETFGSNI
jgi:4-hydroxy-3-methylbut-2-en-1-yl diphosphate reductase